jgi:hypothetical protein
MKGVTVKLGRAQAVMMAVMLERAQVMAMSISLAITRTAQPHYSPFTTTRIGRRTPRGTAVPALMATSYGQSLAHKTSCQI